MSLFKFGSKKLVNRTLQPTYRRSPIEALESRTLYSATPATVIVTIPGPVPTSAIAGVVVHDKIGVNLANNAAGKAQGRATIALFLSTDDVLSSDDAQVQTPTSVPVNIASGKNHTFKVNVKSFPTNLNGQYFLIAEVTGSAVNPAEAAATSFVTIEQAQIDLSAAVSKTPKNGKAGKKIPVSVQVTNVGNIPAKGSLAVNFGFSSTPDGIAPISLGSLSHNINLKAGKGTTLRFMVPLPLGVLTGNQYLVANVDPSNTFVELNLNNNVGIGLQPVIVT